MKKQTTALNFLAIELINKSENDYSNNQAQKVITIDLDSFYDLVEKSLVMEKEQIVRSIIDTIVGSNEIYDKEYPEVRKVAEHYYNETYNL